MSEPLDAELSRLHLTVNRAFLEKLEAARAALSHALPGASMAEILEAGLDLVLARRDRRRGLVDRPRAPRTAPVAESTSTPITAAGAPKETKVANASDAAEPVSGHIPAAVKRAAWTRSGGRCEWPLDGGGTCGSTVRLEFDHVVPRARGGPSTLENIRVLCREHNGTAARRVFGDAWMDQFTACGGDRGRTRPARRGPAP